MTKEQFQFIFDLSFEIRSLFRNVSIQVADFIACQSALETAYGTSDIYRFNCNLFGMKCPKYRISTCIGEERGHALYVNFDSSIIDYFLWLEMSNFSLSSLTDLENFRHSLCESSFNPLRGNYVARIDNVYKLFNYHSDEYTFI